MKNSIKILVVDDDKASSQAIIEVVQRLGFKAVPANKPSDALNVAKLQTVHAAVVDVLLPNMSGVDLACEFRKTKFGDNPVIFVSGVFKDKTFAQEAMEKAAAVNFLFKPYGAQELIDALQTALAPLLTAEKWNVQSLLTRQFKSPRERAKAIERLDRIRGLEFPFVLSLLTDAKISGHLNIVSESGEIFGVTMSRGAVTEVDSSESQSTGVLALIANGFLAQEDWETFQRGGRRKFSLDRLTQENLVSPHAVSFAKREQIIEDLKAIFSAESVQVNFVRQDDVEETAGGVVTMSDLLSQISGALGEFFPLDYLEAFYEPVAGAKMQIAGGSDVMSEAWGLKAFARIEELRTVAERGGTLHDALENVGDRRAALYAGLHYLVLNRFLIFEDVARSQDLAVLVDRFRKMHDQLVNKTPDQVFAYFGGKTRMNTTDVERIYVEYQKSNLPESLPKDAPPELIELCKKCYDLVTAARAVMVDDTKREMLFQRLKDQENERARHANELQVKGLELLRRGQFANAVETLNEAEREHATSLGFILRTWAEIKAGSINSKDRVLERIGKLEALPAEDRRSVYYFMALGVAKKAAGDRTAISAFTKAFEIDSTMVEARRELGAADAVTRNQKKPDILTADISSLVTGFFRRKAD